MSKTNTKTRPQTPPRQAAHDLKRIRAEVRQYLDSHTPFEWHKKDAEYEDNGDYVALVEFRRGMIQRQPEDGRSYLYLADAYALLGEPELAIRVAAILHRAESDCYECQELILELLFSQGKNENDFEWVKRPSVVRLDEGTRERCWDFVNERRFCSTYEIVNEAFHCEYCCFDEEALAGFLAADLRFEVDRANDFDIFVCKRDEFS